MYSPRSSLALFDATWWSLPRPEVDLLAPALTGLALRGAACAFEPPSAKSTPVASVSTTRKSTVTSAGVDTSSEKSGGPRPSRRLVVLAVGAGKKRDSSSIDSIGARPRPM